MNEPIPRLETLPRAQQEIWPKLASVGSDFVLYEGTALSLQLGGRKSVDFDFFTTDPIRVEKLTNRYPFLEGARLRHRAEDSVTFLVGEGPDVVAMSFFGSLRFGRVGNPIRFSDNGIFAAGLLDLAAQKMKVIQQRAELKDYLDIFSLHTAGISMEMALGAARALYPEFNEAISLKALTYFNDIRGLTRDIQIALSAAASKVRDIPSVPKVSNSLMPAFVRNAQFPEFGNPTKDEFSKSREPDLEI